MADGFIISSISRHWEKKFVLHNRNYLINIILCVFICRIPPSSVMFCVLENKKGEDIQMMLLEAFCTEYNIKLIKVL